MVGTIPAGGVTRVGIATNAYGVAAPIVGSAAGVAYGVTTIIDIGTAREIAFGLGQSISATTEV